MINKKIIKTVEHYLFLYQYMDKEIKEIKENSEISNNNDINSWIKSKGRVSKITESQAIKNIETEEKINIILKWKDIIKSTIEKYKVDDPSKELYIKSRYFKNYNDERISMEMAISKTALYQKRLEIIYYIAFITIEEDFLKHLNSE